MAEVAGVVRGKQALPLTILRGVAGHRASLFNEKVPHHDHVPVHCQGVRGGEEGGQV